MMFLELDNKDVAYNLNFNYNNKRFAYSAARIQIEEKNRFSPGIYIFYENIKRAIDQKYPVFDLSRGEDRYKRKFAQRFNVNKGILIGNSAIGKIMMHTIVSINKISYLIDDSISEKNKKKLVKILPEKLRRNIR